MVDPTRLRSKGHGASIRRNTEVIIDNADTTKHGIFDKNLLKLSFTPRDGSPFFEDSVAEFYDGRASSSINTWNGELPARPELIKDFMPALRQRYGHLSRGNWISFKTALRALWRILDELPAGFEIYSLDGIKDAHGELLRRASPRYYNAWSPLVRFAREIAELPPLNWPANYAAEQQNRVVIDKVAGRRIYNAVKAEVRSIKEMWRLGDALIGNGTLPPNIVVERESRLRLRAFYSEHANPLPAGASAAGNLRRGLPVPSYEVPGAKGPSDIGREPFVPDELRPGALRGALRWKYPTAWEISCFFLLLQISTGWNEDTIEHLNLDGDWCTPHPLAEEIVLLKSLKNKTATTQTAISLRRPEFHPYRVLLALNERTAPLRAELRRRLVILQAKIDASPAPSPELEKELGRLRFAVGSPWIFFDGSNLSEIGCFYPWEPLKYPGVVLQAIITKHKICDVNNKIVTIKPSDFRKIWIGFAYANSGHNWMVAKLAAGHRGLDSLRNYFRNFRWHQHSEGRVSALLNALWSEVRARRLINGTVLRQLVEQGKISDEQRRRIQDARERTRVGVGCADPSRPPADVAPGHPTGIECMVQRCVICVHALLFEDSLDGLCRRLAELRHIKINIMSATAWLQSSFAYEEEILEFNLAELFDKDEVDVAIEVWSKRIALGEHEVFEFEGYYGKERLS